MSLLQTPLDLGAAVIAHAVNIILVFSSHRAIPAAGAGPYVGAESLAEGTIVVEILEQEQVLLCQCLAVPDIPGLRAYICLYFEIHHFSIIIVWLLLI